MERLKEIDDRYLIMFVLLAFLAAFVATNNPAIGDLMKVLGGSFGTILITRSEKLIIASDSQTKAILNEFYADRS